MVLSGEFLFRITNKEVKIIMQQRKVYFYFLLIVVFSVSIAWLFPLNARAMMVQPSLEITESWDNGTASFTISTDCTDIVEFAIGNNTAATAWIDNGASTAPPYGWSGSIATKIGAAWYAGTSTADRELSWMSSAVDFEGYDIAFLYHTWQGAEYGTALNIGFTNGFLGTGQAPQSPFAAYSSGFGTISGETTAVPVPAAILLLGSGLIGLVGLRKRGDV